MKPKFKPAVLLFFHRQNNIKAQKDKKNIYKYLLSASFNIWI